MPELPEVETVIQGLMPHLNGSVIKSVLVRHPQLRWPIPADLNECLAGQRIQELSRRGKYILVNLGQRSLIIHLGMSGSLQLVAADKLPTRHDHVDIRLTDGKCLRYNDPRRFGAILMSLDEPDEHPLLKSLGREPLDSDFDSIYFQREAAKSRVAIKVFIMNSKIVTGIGNIYAAEALFLARVHPLTQARALSQQQCEHLVQAIKEVLQAAVLQGGTTVKDFVNSEGKPGYFAQQLRVYGRGGLPCLDCGKPLQSMQLGQRSTVFCESCQS